MNSQLIFRPLQAGDDALLCRFFRGMSGASLQHFTPHAISAGALRRICASDSERRILALLGQEPVGYALLDDPGHPVPRFRMGISDAFTGQGIGHALLRYVMQQAREQGCVALRGEFVPENIRFHRMLHHEGFIQMGRALDGKLLFLGDLFPQESAAIRPLPRADVPMVTRTGVPFRLRSLREDDGEALHAFFGDMGAAGRAFYCPHPIDLPYLDKLCREVGEKPAADRFVAEFDRDGKPFLGGYVFLSPINTSVTSLGIGASEALKGQGLGLCMLRFVQQRARDYGKPVLRLITHPTNYAAQKLYKTCGFEHVGYVANGEHFMLCDLNLTEF